MSPLSKEQLKHHLFLGEQSVEVCLPLPQTPLKTQQWAAHFAAAFDFSLSQADWGADRYQATLTSVSTAPSIQCILCIEWLCDAIWLEPIGAQQSPRHLFNYFVQK
tara:strand:+ start:2267 stop:2584 length:318 start_codon:yes stop_codon:yes gene_type:complete